MLNRSALSLYLVTDHDALYGKDFMESVLAAVRGGVTMVQLREKNIPMAEFINRAYELHEALRTLGVPLIINDNVDVALAVNAEGVHLGQSDGSVAAARARLGRGKIIGLSVENLDQVREANDLDVDYVAVSPLFSTPTKTDTAPPFGLENLHRAVVISKHPVVAIGGINYTNAAQVFSTGVYGIAVVSAILSHPDPYLAACSLLDISYLPPLKFFQEMAEGTLAREKFARYLVVKKQCLERHSMMFGRVAVSLTDSDVSHKVFDFVASYIFSERFILNSLAPKYEPLPELKVMAPVNEYFDYLSNLVEHEHIAVSFSAFLPSIALYLALGLHLNKPENHNNPYYEWFSRFTEYDYNRRVHSMLEIFRGLAKAHPELQTRMLDAYRDSSRHLQEIYNYIYGE